MKKATLLALLCSATPAVAQNFNPAPITTPLTTQDPERTAYMLGQEYVFSTGNNGVPTNLGISVAAGSFLNIRICNTSATRTWYIGGSGNGGAGRFFDTTSTSVTPYFGVANPDALSTAQAATLSGCGAVSPNTCNLSYGTNLNGSTKQSDITFSFGVGSIMTVGGANAVPSGVGAIYPGEKNEINHGRALLPGTCFGQALVGQSTGLTGATAIILGYRAYIYYLQ